MTVSEMPFASILVPYDGSEPANAALALALRIAHPATVFTVVTIVNEAPVIAESTTTVMVYDPTPLLEELDAEGRAVLADAQARCAAAGITPVTHLLHETPVVGVLRAAEETACDLIVMGTHARSGIARAFLGSTTEGVLRSTDIPVLTTRATTPLDDPFGTVVVAIDDSDASDAAVALAGRLARTLGSHLIATHVADTTRLLDNAGTYGFDPQPLEADIKRESAGIVSAALQGAGLDAATVAVALVEGHPAPAILEAAHDRHATAIVVGSHGRRGLRRFLLGSVAETVVRDATIPVLVARRPPASAAG